MYKYTAAHKTLPLPSYVNVKNLTNGKSVIVKINDRGPFVDNRIIDLSYAAAKKIDMLSKGTAVVRVTTVSEEEAAQSFKKNNQSIFSTNIFEKIVSRNKNNILIQIGAFTEEKGAQDLKKRVTNIGVKSVFINKARSGRGVFYRVRVGPIKNIESYEDTIRKLTSLKLDINLISE
jgi:rare lipoprotein A